MMRTGWILILCASLACADEAATNRVAPAVLPFTRALFDGTAPRPGWIRAAGYEQGELMAAPPAWHGSASLPDGKGRVWIDLDRAALDEDLALTLLHQEDSAADLVVQLWDAEGRVVALDLFRNALALADQARTDTFIVPLRANPTATRIMLRRVTGDITLGGAILAPVLLEQPGDLDVLLDLSRRLGDALSPASDLVRRINAISAAARSAVSNATAAAVVRPVAAAVPEGLPPPEPIAYAGLDWLPLRTDFILRDDALRPVPHPRAGGFDYGHWGHGRGPTIVTHVGDRSWRDYRVELDVSSTGVTPRLNPHALNPAYSGFNVMFRVVEHSESWNDKSWSGAGFYVANEGTNRWWGLSATRAYYCDVPRGHFQERQGGGFELAKGNGLVLDRERGNHVRIDVQGDRVQVWFDGQPVCDVTDPRLHEPFEGVTLDHGGIGVMWGFDTMGWARNIRVQPLRE